MLDYLLIDLTGMSILPETMLYTADYLGSDNIRIVKISEKKHFHDFVLEGFEDIDDSTIAILWQQEWIRPENTFLLLKCADVLKRVRPKMRVVVGGYLPTLSPQLFEPNGKFDHILIGYPWAFDGWKNLGEHDRVITAHHPDVLPENLSLQRGMRFVRDRSTMYEVDLKGVVITTYYFSYHCNNKCRFCFNHCWAKYGGGMIKTLGRVEKELDFLVNELGVEVILPKDHNIFVDEEYGKSILDMMANRTDLRLANFIDVMVRDMSEEHIELLAKAGVKRIFFGLEALDAEERKRIHKDYSMEHLEAMVAYGKKYNIMFAGNVMLGLTCSHDRPLDRDYVKSELKRTIPLLIRHRNLSVHFRLYAPLLGTPIGEQIWEDCHQRELIDLESYLKMIQTLIHNDRFKPGLLLPCIYRSSDAADFAAKISKVLELINFVRELVCGYTKIGWKRFFLLLTGDFVNFLKRMVG